MRRRVRVVMAALVTAGTAGVVLASSVPAGATPGAVRLAVLPRVGAGGAVAAGHGKPGGGGGTSSTYGWTSSNWSGYAVTNGAPYTSVTGTWVVPSVSRTAKPTYSAAWLGIDGFNDSTLIQTGTEQDFYNGAAHYSAWWTTSALGFVEQPISSVVVKPGDHMAASISEGSNGLWTITLADTTEGWTFTTSGLSYSGSLASAEWIIEAPTVNGRIAPLAHYGSTVFDLGTVDGASPGLVASEDGAMIQGRAVVSSPSTPDTGDPSPDGFAIAYGSTPPPAPAS